MHICDLCQIETFQLFQVEYEHYLINQQTWRNFPHCNPLRARFRYFLAIDRLIAVCKRTFGRFMVLTYVKNKE